MTDERLEAERAVLGAAMLSPVAAKEAIRAVAAADFGAPRHEVIMESIVALAGRGDPVDVISVVDDLITRGEIDKVGGVEYVHTLTAEVPTASNVGYYADIVRSSAVARALTGVAVRMQDRIVRGEAPGVVLAGADAELHAIRDRTAVARPPRTLGEILDVPAESDAYDWTIYGLLERRDRLILTGSEGGGKSTLMRQIAIMAAAGLQPFSGQQVPPARVLVVDAENTEKQWRRAVRSLAITAAREGVQDPRKGLAAEYLHAGTDLTRADKLGEIHRWMDLVKPDVLVIGPLYRLAPSVKNDEDALPVLAALDTLREHGDGVTLLIEAHSPHADNKTGRRDLRPIGSSALLRWPEFGLGIAKPARVGDPFELVRWRGDRDGRYWPATLTAARNTPQRWPWEPTAGYWAAPAAQTTLI